MNVELVNDQGSCSVILSMISFVIGRRITFFFGNNLLPTFMILDQCQPGRVKGFETQVTVNVIWLQRRKIACRCIRLRLALLGEGTAKDAMRCPLFWHERCRWPSLPLHEHAKWFVWVHSRVIASSCVRSEALRRNPFDNCGTGGGGSLNGMGSARNKKMRSAYRHKIEEKHLRIRSFCLPPIAAQWQYPILLPTVKSGAKERQPDFVAFNPAVPQIPLRCPCKRWLGACAMWKPRALSLVLSCLCSLDPFFSLVKIASDVV